MIQNPVGIDYPIQEMQCLFMDKLWEGVSNDKKRFYHRVFKNPKDGIIRPEVFTEIGNNYKEVKFDKRLTVLSWFDVAETAEDYKIGQNSKSVGIFFAVNLSELYPNLSHRAVEESHADAIRVVQKLQRHFKRPYDILERELAYGDFDTSNLKGYNMHPWHVFRINCECTYTLKCK
jgi:hypothetical protein